MMRSLLFNHYLDRLFDLLVIDSILCIRVGVGEFFSQILITKPKIDKYFLAIVNHKKQ